MELADELGKLLYGMTVEDAQEQYICIRCKKTPTFSTSAGKREYQQTAMCEPCFDEEFGDL